MSFHAYDSPSTAPITSRAEFRGALAIALVFVAAIVLIHGLGAALGLDLQRFGVHPRQWSGLAGIIAAPISSVYPNMGSQVLIMCFVVVVIGGIGSVRGALVSALLVGLVDTFGKVLLPQVAGMLVYMLMAGVLLWKPEGLFRQ